MSSSQAATAAKYRAANAQAQAAKAAQYRQAYSGASKMPIRVKIWWDPQITAYRIATPFSERFVSAVKLLIPASDRAFDPGTKIWTFTERFLSPMQSLVWSIWSKNEVATITRQQVESATSSPAMAHAPLDGAALQFLQVLPFEAAQKAYRHAAMLLHPDRGGDATKMSLLNSLWSKLEKEVWKQ